MDPLKGGKINSIGILNHAYPDLVVLYVTDDLLRIYPDKAFESHLGVLNGFDISFTDKLVIAECFAVVSALDNQKMKKDSDKLMERSVNVEKYICFIHMKTMVI